jgi:hypothetical protein
MHFCPRNHYWNGSYCVVQKVQNFDHALAEVRTTLRQTASLLESFFFR